MPGIHEVKQWMLWGYGDKKQKRPMSLCGKWSGSTWRDDYATFSEAKKALWQFRNALFQVRSGEVVPRSRFGRVMPEGLAFCFTSEDPFIGLDIDDCFDGDPSDLKLADWASEVGREWGLKTYGEISPSGRGLKFWGLGKLPDDFRGKYKHSAHVGNGAFEIYDSSRFFAWTGNEYDPFSLRRINDVQGINDVQDLVDRLLDNHMRIERQKPAKEDVNHPPIGAAFGSDTEGRVDAYIQRSIESDGLPGSGERTTRLFKLAGGIFASGITDDEELVTKSLWNLGLKFTPQWGEDYSYEDLMRQVSNSRTKGTPPVPNPRQEFGSVELDGKYSGIDVSEFGASTVESPDVDDDEYGSNIQDPGPLPIDPQEIPGIIGEYCRFTLETAQKPSPVYALAGGLALMSYLASRAVYDPRFKTHANLFVMSVGASGTGKKHPRSILKAILNAAYKLLTFSGGDLERKKYEQATDVTDAMESGAYAANCMKDHPSHLFALEEMEGMLRDMQSYGAGGKPGPMHKFLQMVLSLHGDNVDDRIKVYASMARGGVVVKHPCPVILGTTTEAGFLENCNPKSVETGLLGRLLVMFCDEKHGYTPLTFDDKRSQDLPGGLVAKVVEWLKLWDVDEPALTGLELTHTAFDRLNKHFEEVHNKKESDPDWTSSIWDKGNVNVTKLSLVFAASRGVEVREITQQDVELAIQVANWCRRKMVYKAWNNSRGSEWANQMSQIFSVILNKGEEGIQDSVLTRRLKSMDNSHGRIDQMKKQLIAEGSVEYRKTSNKGGKWFALRDKR